MTEDARKNVNGKYLCGIIIVLLGMVLFLTGIWLFTRTWGTELLFTNSIVGSFSKYYWIVVCASAVMVLVGVLIIKKYPVKKNDEQQIQAVDTEVAPIQKEEKESDVSEKSEVEIKKCPACGKEIKSGTLFCIYCGEKL